MHSGVTGLAESRGPYLLVCDEVIFLVVVVLGIHGVRRRLRGSVAELVVCWLLRC